MKRCRYCGSYGLGKDGELCERCQWMDALGTLLFAAADEDGVPRPVLDAAAHLLTERTRVRHRHFRELREESVAMQRDAREAYSDGLREGQRQGSEDFW